jgi:aminopeptidase N
MRALTRIDAATRAGVLRPVSYSAQLRLSADETTFDSTTRIVFTAQPGAASFVDVRPEALRSATLNGEPLGLGADFADGRLQLRDLRESNELVVDAVMRYSHDGEGLVRHVDPADGRTYLYAMSFLDAAPRWFACFDQPDLKAPITLDVSCPADWTVAGNGPAVQSAPGQWTVSQSRAVATYMTTLVAGPYHSVRGEHDGIALVLHARASLAEFLDRDAPALLEHSGRCFDEFHRLFGMRYPWGEYHQAFVPDFNAGAMENPGCVTFRDQMIFRSQATDSERVQRNNTIAHEMAHMWFGDIVTMRWWDDLWLNESFAEYLAHRVCSTLGQTESWVQFGIHRKAWGYAADRRPSTHPVAGNGAADAASALNDFDGISYAKGAATLRQLATRLGDDVFLAGLRAYIADYAFGNAALADLLAAWTSAGAVGLSNWAEQWLRTSGLDSLRFTDGVVHREPPADREAQREHAVTVASYDADGAALERVAVVLTGASTVVEVAPGALVLPDANDETWAKVVLPSDAWAAMPGLLPELDPLARVVAWNALELAVADSDVAPALAIEIVTAAVPREPSDTVLGTVLSWAVGLCGTYLPDDSRPAALSALNEAASAALSAAAPGSGRQLAGLRGVVATSADVERLERLRSGEVPSGVRLDPDLRWRLVARLCALGELGVSEIDAELFADDSTEGAEQAARCRAIRPDEAAKREAWQLLMLDTELANSQLYAVASGFWQPAQATLTAPYVERYFAEIAATASLRSGWVVGRLAGLAYPSTAVSSATLQRTSQLLERADLAVAIRRAVTDQGDDLRRALTSRETFSEGG